MLDKLGVVFTKEYREETAYREFVHSRVADAKLKNQSEDVGEKVRRLEDEGFVSDFEITVGEY